ncbi:MAG: hypothetical protein R3C01_10685 [Planctomycetaceae bacterium]
MLALDRDMTPKPSCFKTWPRNPLLSRRISQGANPTSAAVYRLEAKTARPFSLSRFNLDPTEPTSLSAEFSARGD